MAFRLEMHVRCDNQYKTGADGETILGQPTLFVCFGICVLSPAHESEMRGYLGYLLIVKYSLILFKFSLTISDLTALSLIFFIYFFLGGVGGGWGGIIIFLERSVDHIIFRDFTANQRSFIYCSLACANQS